MYSTSAGEGLGIACQALVDLGPGGLPAVRRLFPFYLSLDAQGCVDAVGPALRACRLAVPLGAKLSAIFEGSGLHALERNASADAVAGERHAHLRWIEAPHHELHGAWYAFGTSRLFLGWPLLSSEDELGNWGLSRSDFPTHFPLADFLMLLTVGRNNLLDAQRLNELVTAKSHQLAALNEQLNHRLYHDALTDLPNRLAFCERLSDTLQGADARRSSVAVLLVDIDQMKSINGLWGARAGDELLRRFAERLAGLVGGENFVGRLQGAEFGIVLNDLAERTGAEDFARQCRAALERPVAYEDAEISAQVSVGIAIFPDDGQSAQTLLQGADAALREVKKRGGRGIQMRRAVEHDRLLEQLALTEALKGAANRGELFVEYQPVVNIRTRRIVGAEALLRWQHPQLGRVGPDRFIPLAEQAGLMPEIGEWVLRAACTEAKSWPELPDGLPHLAVNVSAFQIRRPEFLDRVRTLLAEVGHDPHRLVLELTESGLLEDERQTTQQFQALAALGTRMAMDDFGTGYASLQSASRLPFNVIKLDRSFLASERRSDRALLLTAMDMARHLQMSVVAEGVETAQQHAFLLQHGCQHGQGYWYSRPVSASALRALMAAAQALGKA